MKCVPVKSERMSDLVECSGNIMRWFWRVVAVITLFFTLHSASGRAADIEVERIPKSKSDGVRKNFPDVYRIQITGEFRKSDDQKFRDAIANLLPLFGVVVLDSPGGELTSALAIGKVIKLRGYSTIVRAGDVWASACALIWLAGETRYMDPSSKIGFHAAHVVKGHDAVESGMANALVGAYLSQLGLATDAIKYITSPSPSDVQWLSIRHAMLLGINVTISSEVSAK